MEDRGREDERKRWGGRRQEVGRGRDRRVGEGGREEERREGEMGGRGKGRREGRGRVGQMLHIRALVFHELKN